MADTELQYVKKRIKQLENDFAGFASLLIESGIVEVQMEDGKLTYKVNKVKLDAKKSNKEQA